MRVLSIKQPWATLIVRGVKRFEARTWQTPHRGQIALHASSGTAPYVFDEADDDDVLGTMFCNQGWGESADLKALPRTAVVGTVEILTIMPAKKIWHSLTPDDKVLVGSFEEPPDDLYLWELANPRELSPVQVNGKLNLWTLPDDVAAAVASTIASASKPVDRLASASAIAEAQRVRSARIAEKQAAVDRFRATPVKVLSPLNGLLGFDSATHGAVIDGLISFAKAHLQESDGRITVTPQLQLLFRRKRRAVDWDELTEAAREFVEELG